MRWQTVKAKMWMFSTSLHTSATNWGVGVMLMLTVIIICMFWWFRIIIICMLWWYKIIIICMFWWYKINLVFDPSSSYPDQVWDLQVAKAAKIGLGCRSPLKKSHSCPGNTCHPWTWYLIFVTLEDFSGRFDTSRSLIALFVSEISPSGFFVIDRGGGEIAYSSSWIIQPQFLVLKFETWFSFAQSQPPLNPVSTKLYEFRQTQFPKQLFHPTSRICNSSSMHKHLNCFSTYCIVIIINAGWSSLMKIEMQRTT